MNAPALPSLADASTPVFPQSVPMGKVTITAKLPANDSSYASAMNFYQGYGAQAFAVRLWSVNGAAASQTVVQHTTCSSTTCVLSPVVLPAGTDVISVLYAMDNSQGTTGAQLLPFSYVKNITVTVHANTTTSTTVTLRGAPGFYYFNFASSPANGTIAVTLGATDAAEWCSNQTHMCFDGGSITGAYANWITITDSDTSGATGISMNGAAPAHSVVSRSAGDVLRLVVKSGANVHQAFLVPSAAFNATEFHALVTLQPDTDNGQDPNGLGFTCHNGACWETGPFQVIVN